MGTALTVHHLVKLMFSPHLVVAPADLFISCILVFDKTFFLHHKQPPKRIKIAVHFTRANLQASIPQQ
jgi:hypothetical protein